MQVVDRKGFEAPFCESEAGAGRASGVLASEPAVPGYVMPIESRQEAPLGLEWK